VKGLVSIIAMAVAVAFAVPARAQEPAPQPLTRAGCDQAGMSWDNQANVCGSDHHGKHGHGEGKHGHGKDKAYEGPATEAGPQPLTKADCAAAGMHWSNHANVCGKEKKHHGKKKKHGHGKKKKHGHGKNHGSDHDKNQDHKHKKKAQTQPAT
jgi:hypothetical protein